MARRRQQGNALVFGLGDCVQTRDGGFVVFNCIGSMFRRLCEMIGHTELLDDPRFRTDASRYTPYGADAVYHCLGQHPDD